MKNQTPKALDLRMVYAVTVIGLLVIAVVVLFLLQPSLID
jgi:hypothetical protein